MFARKVFHSLTVDSDDSRSDEEESEEFFMTASELIPHLRTCPVRPDFFSSMGDRDFRERFRFTKSGVLHIYEKIEHMISPKSFASRATSGLTRLLITLRFYSTGTFQSVFGDLFNIHRTTAGRIVRKVTDALLTLRSEVIRMPVSDEELRSSMLSFYNFVHPQGIPGVIGLIDCTHVKICSPSKY